MRLLAGLTVVGLGVDGSIIPGLNLLPSFIVDPIVNQVKSTAEALVVNQFGAELPLVDGNGDAIATSGNIIPSLYHKLY